MKKHKKWLATIGTSAALLLMAGCAQPADETVVTFEDYELTQGELFDLLMNEPAGSGFTLGERLIEQELLMEMLNKEFGTLVSDEDFEEYMVDVIASYGDEGAFEEFLETERYSRNQIEQEVRIALLMEAAVRENHPVDEEEMKQMHDEAVPTGTRVAHILVDDKDTANDVIKQLDDGGDFASLVTDYSLDEESVEHGGEYMLVTGEMMPEFEEAALKLARDEYTSEPVSTLYGYHVIKMVTEGTKDTYEEMEDELENTWYQRLTEFSPGIYDQIIYDVILKYEDDISINQDSVSDLVERMLAFRLDVLEVEDPLEATEGDEGERIFEGESDEELQEFSEEELINEQSKNKAPDDSSSVIEEEAEEITDEETDEPDDSGSVQISAEDETDYDDPSDAKPGSNEKD